MESIAPFGSGNISDVPVQKFMGATVSKFTCSADFASQPGSCAIDLVQDDTDNDRFLPGVIGSPYYFQITDVDNNIIFQYNGLLDTIARESTPDSRNYKVTLISPLRILESATLIIDGYTGYGSTIEGLPQFFSDDGYYQINDDDTQPGYLPDGVSMTPTVEYFKTAPYSYSTNNSNLNYTGMWGRVYNLINVFAAYENEWIDDDGNPIAVVPFAGFGASSVKSGMRVDKIAYAIDEIVNRTEAISPRRYIGGNLMYGANTWNICGTASGYIPPYPFAYGFDIISFVSHALNYLPVDFVIPGPSISIAEFVSIVCDTINADFIVELNDSTYQNGAFYANMSQTYPNSIFGGIISILLIPRNQYVSCERPFSQFTYDLLNLEKPDTGDYGSSGNINPGIPPLDDGRFINPMDFDYTRVGSEGSYQYGGVFPVTPTPTTILNSITNRPVSLSVSLKSTNPTAGKMVVGGFQTRMNVVPRDYIYQYWGEITSITASGDSCGIFAKSIKSIPVITQMLPPNDVFDWVAIDMQSIVSNLTLTGLVYDGIYFASMMEIRAAMCSKESWLMFMNTFKSHKMNILNNGGLFEISNADFAKHKATTAKYLKYIGKGSIVLDEEDFTSPETYKIIDQIHGKIRDIGETHYGKSWVAPVPVCQTKRTFNDESIVGDFVRSWDISSSAYVEPYAYDVMDAPKDSSFIEDGRLKAFANFEHSFTPDQSGVAGFGLLTGQLTGFASGVRYKFDFSEHDTNTVFDYDPAATGDCSDIGLAHVPVAIESKYIFAPSAYFTWYNRGHCPFLDSVDTIGASGLAGTHGNFYLYSYGYQSKGVTRNGADATLLESMVNDSNSKTFHSSTVVKNVLSPTLFAESGGYNTSSYVFTPSNGMFSHNDHTSGFYWQKTDWYNPQHQIEEYNTVETTNGDYTAHFSFNYTGTAMKDILDGIRANPANDAGSGLPFIRFTTSPVYYPETINNPGINPLNGSYMDNIASTIRLNAGDLASSETANYSDFGALFGRACSSKPACSPQSVGIPQKSNRYMYGPWITNFSEIIYCGKFDYEVNDELVPENFMIPSYGTINTNWQVVDQNGNVTSSVPNITGTAFSGFAGMNLAGQAVANSIDDFSLFAQEEGTLTLVGLPIVTRVGQVMTNGPRITDISLNFDGSTVQTSYNFRTLTPRLGKDSKALLKELRKFSNNLRQRKK